MKIRFSEAPRFSHQGYDLPAHFSHSKCKENRASFQHGQSQHMLKKVKHFAECNSQASLVPRDKRSARHSNYEGYTVKKHSRQLDSKLASMKVQLQKLSYRQKLDEIEAIIIRSSELCQGYGYFYLTTTMLEYCPDAWRKISIWVHADGRFTIPLHPIKRRNDFLCELEFVSCMRRTLKQLFPTIDLGDGTTFVKMLVHIKAKKDEINTKIKKCLSTVSSGTFRQCHCPLETKQQNRLSSNIVIPENNLCRSQDRNQQKKSNPEEQPELRNSAKTQKQRKRPEPLKLSILSSSIQNQFNDLFSPSDVPTNQFYDNSPKKDGKKSFLSKVTEEFQELLL